MRREETISRIDRLLKSDKTEITEETYAAALSDFTKIANEYFETDGSVNFQINQVKSEFFVTVSFPAVRIKNFTVLK